jgi:hypothetical protein
MTVPFPVIPAEAGIQRLLSGAKRRIFLICSPLGWNNQLDSRLRGNDDFPCLFAFGNSTAKLLPSCLRRDTSQQTAACLWMWRWRRKTARPRPISWRNLPPELARPEPARENRPRHEHPGQGFRFSGAVMTFAAAASMFFDKKSHERRGVGNGGPRRARP